MLFYGSSGILEFYDRFMLGNFLQPSLPTDRCFCFRNFAVIYLIKLLEYPVARKQIGKFRAGFQRFPPFDLANIPVFLSLEAGSEAW